MVAWFARLEPDGYHLYDLELSCDPRHLLDKLLNLLLGRFRYTEWPLWGWRARFVTTCKMHRRLKPSFFCGSQSFSKITGPFVYEHSFYTSFGPVLGVLGRIAGQGENLKRIFFI